MELTFTLHPAQYRVFTAPQRFVSLMAGRRFGKTNLAIARAVTSAVDPANTRKLPVFLVAPTQAQAKLFYWQPLKKALAPLLANENVNEGMLYLDDGMQVGVKGSDRPDTLRGVGLYDVILDEFADMKSETWSSILRPALADVQGRALFIGTPKPRNHFTKLHEEAKADESGEWAAFDFTTYDNPFIPREEIEAARRTLSRDEFEREFMASTKTYSSRVFQLDTIKYMTSEPKALANDREVEKPGDWYVSVDLAGFADVEKAADYRAKRLDNTAIAVVKVFDDGTWWVNDVILGRWGIEQTADEIVKAVKGVKSMRLGIEKGALFNAVTPLLRQKLLAAQCSAAILPLSHENKSKNDRVAWALQGRIEQGKVIFRRADWNREVEHQFAAFPNALVHDDGVEAIAYVAQMAHENIFDGIGGTKESEYWTPLDTEIGF